MTEKDTSSAQDQSEHAFENPSRTPSPTTSEEEKEIPELIPIEEDPPIPTPIEEDIQEIEDEVWVPPLEQLPTHRRKRRYSQISDERQIYYARNRQVFDERIGPGHIWEQ